MRKLRPFVMILTSLGIGLAAMTVAAQWLRERGEQQTRPVLVAQHDLSAGTRLDRTMLEVAQWPNGLALPPALSRPEDAEGRVITSALLRGEPLLQAKLAATGETGGLSALLREGRRAVTVKVNEIVGVAGFALPGNFVDVMVHTTDPQNQPVSRIVLERIRVMAVAQDTGPQENRPRVVNAVTLEVTPEEAERMDLARSVGTLSLVLRSQSDTAPVVTQGARKRDVLLAEAPAAPVAKPTAPRRSPPPPNESRAPRSCAASKPAPSDQCLCIRGCLHLHLRSACPAIDRFPISPLLRDNMTLPLNRSCLLRGLALSLSLFIASLPFTEPVLAQSPPPPTPTSTAGAARAPATPAQPPGPVERGQSLRLVAGKSTLLAVPNDILRISVGNPDVADVVLTHPREVYLLGKKSGQTNLMLWGKGGTTRLHDITVSADTETLRTKLQEWVPGIDELKVEALGDHLLLSGLAHDAVKVQRAMHMAEAFGGEKKIINLMRVGSAQQVMLEVKVAEVSRNLLDELGVDLTMTRVAGDTTLKLLTQLVSTAVGTGNNQSPGGSLNAIGSSGKTNATLTARADKGLVKILAEPTITAIHGQEGSFLAGGRIYIPVPQTSSTGASTITLEEKEFGVGLRFMPTVLEDGLINLRVTPEVSELSQEGTLIRGANNVTSLLPAITTRRASTTVQLRNGESFVIGGLIKSNVTEAIKAFPVLGELPILGALFRSTSFQTQKSELLFVVTPHLARPVASRPQLPTDGFVPPTRSELFLEGRLEGRPAAPANPKQP